MRDQGLVQRIVRVGAAAMLCGAIAASTPLHQAVADSAPASSPSTPQTSTCSGDKLATVSADDLAKLPAGWLGFHTSQDDATRTLPVPSAEWEKYELDSQAAIRDANARQRASGQVNVPVPIEQPALPESAWPKLKEIAATPIMDCTPPNSHGRLSAAAKAAAGRKSIAEQGTCDNYECYHSMHVDMDAFSQTADTDLIEYAFWLGPIGTSEASECTSSASNVTPCIWFNHALIRMRNQNNIDNGCGLHFGPIRGDIYGPTWGLNFGYYCNPGLPNGVDQHLTASQINNAITNGVWYRLQVARTFWGLAYPGPDEFAVSTWDLILTTEGGSPVTLGSFNTVGKNVGSMYIASEHIERFTTGDPTGPCSTDLESEYFDDIKVRLDNTIGLTQHGRVGVYETEADPLPTGYCTNTNVEDHTPPPEESNQQFEFRRETTRTNPQGTHLWETAK